MSRYEDCDGDSPISASLWWAMTNRSAHCNRGIAILQELERILVEMPDKRLVAGVVSDAAGGVCAIGAYAKAKAPEKLAEFEKRWGHDFGEVGLVETARLGEQCGMAHVLAWAIAYHNDETFSRSTPEERYAKILAWTRRVIAGGNADTAAYGLEVPHDRD